MKQHMQLIGALRRRHMRRCIAAHLSRRGFAQPCDVGSRGLPYKGCQSRTPQPQLTLHKKKRVTNFGIP